MIVQDDAELRVTYDARIIGELWQGGEGAIDVSWEAPPLTRQQDQPDDERRRIDVMEYDADAVAYFCDSGEVTGDFQRVLEVEIWRQFSATTTQTDSEDVIVSSSTNSFRQRILPSPVFTQKEQKAWLHLVSEIMHG